MTDHATRVRWTIISHATERLTGTSVAIHAVCQADGMTMRTTFTMIFSRGPSGQLRLGAAAHYSPESVPPRQILQRHDIPHHILDLAETRALAELDVGQNGARSSANPSRWPIAGG